ncbi:hypothetical protein [Pseudomonas orientalis]|uniref:Uncharacterized protein n=1 Tax=Pseudomonas orientalis TaxID=76758 RepID=A0A4Q7D0G3_9PSED|nr:hypothetical protein [Pseudomonas orientalis]RZI31157.1 hypothetical protein EUX57_14160 [Pseudomonas orientalis]
MSHGNFFAVGSGEFAAACELGMNPAVALLVMARGTGRDNATTSWSALAVSNSAGIARRRAKEAIDALIDNKIVDLLEIKAGRFPKYKINKPEDDELLLWLPNELVDGAANEVPPITKIRERGEIDLLEKFIRLYGIQDLDGDGGIPRDVAWATFVREKICPIGHFVLYGFSDEKTQASNKGLFDGYADKVDEDGNRGPWTVLSPLFQMGLLEKVYYMAESSEPDAELIYPAGPHGTAQAIWQLMTWLEEGDGKGFAFQAQNHDTQGIAPKHIKNAAMVGLYRLRYRPKTGKTSRWWAVEQEQAEAMVGMVSNMCGEKPRVHIKAVQGS